MCSNEFEHHFRKSSPPYEIPCGAVERRPIPIIKGEGVENRTPRASALIECVMVVVDTCMLASSTQGDCNLKVSSAKRRCAVVWLWLFSVAYAHASTRAPSRTRIISINMHVVRRALSYWNIFSCALRCVGVGDAVGAIAMMIVVEFASHVCSRCREGRVRA